MAVTLSDDEVSDNESGSDEDGNFITFTATAVVDESVVADENPSDGELSENVDLQEAYNKLCKVAAKDAMNVDLGLQKIASLELDKKILLMKLFDANELLDKVNTENMLLLGKVKNLELELSFVREQTNRAASFKLEHMLSIQNSPLDKIGLGFEDSITASKTYSTNFVSSSEPSISEIVKPADVTSPKKIRVDFKESKPRLLTLLRTRCMIDLHGFVIFVESLGTFVQIVSSCKLLSEQKPKVHVPQTQDPMVLIGKLVKTLNLYSNHGVAQHSNRNNNSNANKTLVQELHRKSFGCKRLDLIESF